MPNNGSKKEYNNRFAFVDDSESSSDESEETGESSDDASKDKEEMNTFDDKKVEIMVVEDSMKEAEVQIEA